MSKKFETPNALHHDAGMVVDDARHVLSATAEMTDRTIVEARHQLTAAMDRLRETASRLESVATQRAKEADACVRRHPYATVGIALGIGALLGHLLAGER